MLTSNRSVTIALVIALAAVIVALVASPQRDSASTAEAAGSVDARAELTDAVASASSAIAASGHDVRNAAAALRSATAEAVTGSEDVQATRERVEVRAERLRVAADGLEDASGPTIRVPSDELPAAEPVLDRVTAASEQASDVARAARDAADRTERVALAALELTAAAAELAAESEDPPNSDDPEAVADAWRDDLALLETYRATAEKAADHPWLGELAAAHLAIVDDLETDARTALELLDDGDIDGYNDHRQDRLGDVDTLADALLVATRTSLETAVSQLEDAEGRTLALLAELEALRRDTPDQLAGG